MLRQYKQYGNNNCNEPWLFSRQKYIWWFWWPSQFDESLEGIAWTLTFHTIIIINNNNKQYYLLRTFCFLSKKKKCSGIFIIVTVVLFGFVYHANNALTYSASVCIASINGKDWIGSSWTRSDRRLLCTNI